MAKSDVTVNFDHDEARVNVLLGTVFGEICVAEAPRMVQ